LQRLVAEVAHETGDCCLLELIAFPGRVVLDSRGYGKAKGMASITISHNGPLDQPAGPDEKRRSRRSKSGSTRWALCGDDIGRRAPAVRA
jgi:hypothetical protein